MKKGDLLGEVGRDTSDAESELTTLSYDELLDIVIKNRLSPLEIPHHRAQLLGADSEQWGGDTGALERILPV